MDFIAKSQLYLANYDKRMAKFNADLEIREAEKVAKATEELKEWKLKLKEQILNHQEGWLKLKEEELEGKERLLKIYENWNRLMAIKWGSEEYKAIASGVENTENTAEAEKTESLVSEGVESGFESESFVSLSEISPTESPDPTEEIKFI